MIVEIRTKRYLNAIGYAYSLESINLETEEVNLFCKATEEILSFSIHLIISNNSILDEIYVLDAARIGYRYGMNLSNGTFINSPSMDTQILKKGQLNIAAIARDKKLMIEDFTGQFIFAKDPMALYKNTNLLKKFSSSQALYIGYLTGVSTLPEKSEKNIYSYLRVTK